MATLPKPKTNCGVPATPKRRTVPVVPLVTTGITSPPKSTELPKTAPPRRPIPRKAPTIVVPVDEAVILDKINQRQRQIILHSVLYYKLNTNIVADFTWDTWARELVKLQADYAELTKTSVFYRDMKDFDGTTGFHLANHSWGLHKAIHIRNVHQSK